jgi:tripartite-type tricarboxylate transporter receptor subunit TctC
MMRTQAIFKLIIGYLASLVLANAVGAQTQSAAESAATAASFPVKPIKLVIPFPPGGATDILGRTLAQKLSVSLGQQVIVENKPGAGGTIGADSVAKAAPDGYTLLMTTSSTHSIAPALQPKLPYDPVKDFVPVAHFANAASVLVVGKEFPAKTVSDLVVLLKNNPGKYNFGSSGIGTYPHLMGEMFKLRAGNVFAVHIPYRGTGLVMTDLIAGQISYLMDSIVSAQSHIKDGKIRALAVSGAKRNASLPDVPTFTESGIKGLELSNWFGVIAPANTPAAIVQRINKEVNDIAKQTEVQERFSKTGADAVPAATPIQFAKIIRDEYDGWKTVIQRANIKPE